MSINGEHPLPDEENPEYLFSTTATLLLVNIINGKIAVKQLALEQLKNRGLDKEGKWVGFDYE